MIRVGLYGRHACAALAIVASLAAAAGARAAWRDPKYHKPEETSKEDFDVVVIDPDAPNAVQVGKTFAAAARNGDVQVFSAHELQEIADYLDVELPGTADEPSSDQEAELQRLEDEARERAQVDAERQAALENAGNKAPTGSPVEELPYPVLKKLAKQHEITSQKKDEILAALKDKGVITVAAEALAALTAE